MALRFTIRVRIIKEINQVLQKVPSPSFKTYFTIVSGCSPKIYRYFYYFYFIVFFHKISCVDYFMAPQFLVGQGFLIIEVSRSHSDTPYSLGLL